MPYYEDRTKREQEREFASPCSLNGSPQHAIATPLESQ